MDGGVSMKLYNIMTDEPIVDRSLIIDELVKCAATRATSSERIKSRETAYATPQLDFPDGLAKSYMRTVLDRPRLHYGFSRAVSDAWRGQVQPA